MEKNNEVQIVKDLPNKIITVTRQFDASRELVWNAWTESELLDEWWAPHPWKAKTKMMNFEEGGSWLYAMTGPDQSKIWSMVIFNNIKYPDSFQTTGFFCDEQGIKNSDMPSMDWKNQFEDSATGTTVIVEISFDKESDLTKLIEMGFESGFISALNNLEQYLSSQFKLRSN